VLVIFIYRRYGREKPFTVPEVLSYVPNPSRKPLEVNVVFTGDAMRGDKNAFFATLLDLHRRKAIETKLRNLSYIILLEISSSYPCHAIETHELPIGP